MATHNPQDRNRQDLERRILYGMAREWESACGVLPPSHRRRMRLPLFSLGDMKTRWGLWTGRLREIRLSRELVLRHSWDSVREVLHHEMAHQLAEEVLGAHTEPAHGPTFRRACALLRANPRACAGCPALDERLARNRPAQDDKVTSRVRKLMALAASPNRHEAQMAIAKAHELIEKHNLDLLARGEPREFASVFLGAPALRHGREDYLLALLLQDFYFVRGIWVSAYVLECAKMGRALEISGTPQNVRRAAYVHDFVRNFIRLQWTAYNGRRGLGRYRRRDFAVGILEGFRSRLEAMDAEREKSLGEAGRALVKTGDPRLAEYFAWRYPRTVAVRRAAGKPDGQVLRDGRETGKTLVIHQGIENRESRGRMLSGG